MASRLDTARALQVKSALVVDVAHAAGLKRADIAMDGDRDVWYHDAVPAQPPECAPAWVDAEHPLFLLYTSGSTGTPKGVQHSTGGYMVYAATTSKYVFNLAPGDVYWCTADCGWITGHSYLVYGPLLNGVASLVFEGVPNYPDCGRFWAVVAKWRVKQFYTAPTAIRALMGHGDAAVTPHDRSSLEARPRARRRPPPFPFVANHLGSTMRGRPPRAVSGPSLVGARRGARPRCRFWAPLASRSIRRRGGGTTRPWARAAARSWTRGGRRRRGGHMLTPLPGAWAEKPGSATLPFFGAAPALLDPESGEELHGPAEGVLCFKQARPVATLPLAVLASRCLSDAQPAGLCCARTVLCACGRARVAHAPRGGA